jgi:hypothetical protein
MIFFKKATPMKCSMLGRNCSDEAFIAPEKLKH